MENQETQTQENLETQENQETKETQQQETAFSWKSNVGTDLRDSPLMQKFEDTSDGLNKAIESHANLEKLLGHEKVPIPKDADDTEGWARFSKAMGIPDKADGYKLGDVQMPEAMKGFSIDKKKFAEVVHQQKLTPAQGEGLWKVYNELNVQTFNQAMTEQQNKINETINSLKGEWGDAYDSNVELGQMVINKFSDSQEMNDMVTSVLSKDPHGIKFLAKIGGQFAENKIGDFHMKRFTVGPEEARDAIDKIMKDPDHAYFGLKSTAKEHDAAVEYVNSLYATINRAKGQA